LVLVFLFEYRHTRSALRQLGRAWSDEKVKTLIFGKWLIGVICFGGFYLSCILALAGWEWGETASQRDRSSLELVIVADDSRSMRAQDNKPDRMGRGLEIARAVVEALPGSRVAVVAFAGQAVKLVPMTEDRLALDNALAGLRAGKLGGENPNRILPANGAGGSHLAQALDLALSSFQANSQRNQAMLLISDGEFTGPSPMAQINQARQRGIPLAVIACGSPGGARIPQSSGAWLLDGNGREVVSRLQEAGLRDLAERTRAWYVAAGDDDPADAMAKQLSRFVERSAREGFILIPVNRDYLFVVTALIFLAAYLGVRAIRWRSIW
jgi:Ca-activated chloride channel family protein